MMWEQTGRTLSCKTKSFIFGIIETPFKSWSFRASAMSLGAAIYKEMVRTVICRGWRNGYLQTYRVDSSEFLIA